MDLINYTRKRISKTYHLSLAAPSPPSSAPYSGQKLSLVLNAAQPSPSISHALPDEAPTKSSQPTQVPNANLVHLLDVARQNSPFVASHSLLPQEQDSLLAVEPNFLLQSGISGIF